MLKVVCVISSGGVIWWHSTAPSNPPHLREIRQYTQSILCRDGSDAREPDDVTGGETDVILRHAASSSLKGPDSAPAFVVLGACDAQRPVPDAIHRELLHAICESIDDVVRMAQREAVVELAQRSGLSMSDAEALAPAALKLPADGREACAAALLTAERHAASAMLGFASGASPGERGEEGERKLPDGLADRGRERLAEAAGEASRFRRAFIQRDASGATRVAREADWSTQLPQRGRLAAWLREMVGAKRAVDAEDLAALLPPLREKLASKNVAVGIATTLCDSVAATARGRALGTFERLSDVVRGAMMETLRRILYPRAEIDLLALVAAAVSRHRPFVVAFCGVNGVGKSTTLAKVAFWLQQHGHRVMLAAGDTFRAGAIEQLAVHAACLGAPLFALDYDVDPVLVARGAIASAVAQQCHVVLLDTAGRMQNHESRMRALARLIHDADPDLVLFVAEATVGHSGVEQLRHFNRQLAQLTPRGRPTRGIDALVLTKLDTVDDKVGAAVSMVYELGQQILFVGVGQTYQDLKVLHPEAVIELLMQ